MLIKGNLASHLEVSVQIHCKGEEVEDLSFLAYMDLVLKSFVKRRNCCLVVRFFQIATPHLHSGSCVCVSKGHLIVGECLCHCLFCWFLSALRGRKAVASLQDTRSLKLSRVLFLSAERPKGSHLGRIA